MRVKTFQNLIKISQQLCTEILVSADGKLKSQIQTFDNKKLMGNSYDDIVLCFNQSTTRPKRCSIFHISQKMKQNRKTL